MIGRPANSAGVKLAALLALIVCVFPGLIGVVVGIALFAGALKIFSKRS